MSEGGGVKLGPERQSRPAQKKRVRVWEDSPECPSDKVGDTKENKFQGWKTEACSYGEKKETGGLKAQGGLSDQPEKREGHRFHNWGKKGKTRFGKRFQKEGGK